MKRRIKHVEIKGILRVNSRRHRVSDKIPATATILDLLNRARIKLGGMPLKELPRGIPDSSQHCVLGRSLGFEFLLDHQDHPFALVLKYHRACALAAAWDVPRPYAVWNGWAVRVPEALSRFIHNFDARRYPQLISRQDTSLNRKGEDRKIHSAPYLGQLNLMHELALRQSGSVA
jgi:hypothetical protein